jgi:lysophospholipase L1-like esterase
MIILLRNILLGILILFLIAGGFFMYMLISNRHFIDSRSLTYGPYTSRVDSHIKIAVIGDSWAAGQKLDAALSAALDMHGLPAEIVSYGQPGGKSRDILDGLTDKTRSQPLLEDKDIDFFVVFAGVNDSKGHDGPDFYKHHMGTLISLISSHGAIPVIIDIPDYAISLDKPPTIQRAAKRIASKVLFDSNSNDNREEYRKALRELRSSGNQFILIPADQLPSYVENQEMWRDPIHLNENGYFAISKVIADALLKKIQDDPTMRSTQRLPAVTPDAEARSSPASVAPAVRSR